MEMWPSQVAAELADQKEGRLGKSSENVLEAVSPESWSVTHETGRQAQVVLIWVSYYLQYGLWRLLSFVL